MTRPQSSRTERLTPTEQALVRALVSAIVRELRAEHDERPLARAGEAASETRAREARRDDSTAA